MIDGEGCISISRRKPQTKNKAKSYNYVLMLKVSMCHRKTIEHLHQLFGVGSLHIQKTQYKHYTRPWIWFCNAEAAMTVLRAIQPHMVTKKAEALVAFEFAAIAPTPKGGKNGSQKVSPATERRRRELWHRMKMLKTRNQSARRKRENRLPDVSVS